MSGFESLVPAPLLRAIGLALIHFLWQGFLIGAVLSTILALLRNRSPQSRYAVCLVAMLVMMAVPVFTAIRTLPGEKPLVLSGVTGVPTSADISLVLQWASPALPWLALLWVLGFATLQVRLIVSWLLAEKVRRLGTKPASLRLQRELAELCKRLRISKAVSLVESDRVTVPTVLGWLSPVVLLPVGLASSLPMAQVRAIIAHELAHIRRYDYLVNAIQHVFESILFFHPVTWWVSGRLRAEREYCCDDIALSVSDSALQYARALSTLEELRDRQVLLAPTGTGGSLMRRISRILRGDDTSPVLGVKWPLLLATAACVLTLVMLIVTSCMRTAGPEASAAVEAGQDEASLQAASSNQLSEAEVLQAITMAREAGCLTQEQADEILQRIREGGQFVSFACGENGEGRCIGFGFACGGEEMSPEELQALCDGGACCGGEGVVKEGCGQLPDGRACMIKVQTVGDGI